MIPGPWKRYVAMSVHFVPSACLHKLPLPHLNDAAKECAPNVGVLGMKAVKYIRLCFQQTNV